MPGVAIFGITGRMGQALLRALREAAGAAGEGAGGADDAGARADPPYLVGALASPGSSRLGADAAADGPPSGVPVTALLAEALRGAAVAIDFSRAAGVAEHVAACAAARVPLLVGTTGLDAAARQHIAAAAEVIPVLVAPNTSVGVNVMLHLVRRAARALGEADLEIAESHHRQKRDAPSGTALALGRAAAEARGRVLEAVAIFDRQGELPPRAAGAIGFSVLRAGDIVGEHTVTLALAGERLEITHRATDRMVFARGALRAADWLRRASPGVYSMDDVLGLDN